MGVQYPAVPFLVIMVMLTFGQFSTCRDIHRSAIEGTKTEIKTQFRSPFPWHFPAAAPAEAKSVGTDPIYGTSDRTVPGGPNPLHN